MATKAEQIRTFFRAVGRANEVLKTSDQAWQDLRPQMQAGSDLEFERLRDYFRAGIPAGWGERDVAASARLFEILKEQGGPELVGPDTAFDASLFWTP